MTELPIGPGAVALGLDEDELVQCVGCGLCLPHCPTYRVTGLESASPRGRINAMRAVALEGAPIDAAFVEAMDACVLCRGCEAACPSAVPFGHLMEGTRSTLVATRADRRGVLRRLADAVAYRRVLGHPRVLRFLTALARAAQRLHLVPKRLGLPQLTWSSVRPLDAPRGPDSGDVWLLTGCVMDAWQRDVHRATLAVVRAVGGRPMLPGPAAACCGALHQHAGRAAEARRLAARTMAGFPGTAPILVDSAGCGAAMKDYGRLLGTAEARAFAARVLDVHEWLAEQGPLPVRPTGRTVVVQDPCHLRHVQRAHGAVRTVLSQAYALRETADDGLCCGAGGAYAVAHPDLAGEVRDRKVAALRATGVDPLVVASANPGCLLHLQGAGLTVRHPVELVAEALLGEP